MVIKNDTATRNRVEKMVILCLKMLTVTGNYNLKELIERARGYITTYSYAKEMDEIRVPFRHNGQVKYVRFAYLALQWVYISVEE